MKLSTLTVVLLLGITTINVLSAKTENASEAEVCPRKEHLSSRKCKKECTSDADCKGRKKKCVCDDVCGLTCLNPKGKCPKPRIANGKAKVAGRNQLGAVARYSCHKGYRLQGVETRICNGDREWSGEAPICVPNSEIKDPLADTPLNIDSGSDKSTAWCPEPPSVAFADHDGAKQTYFLPGSEVKYTCRFGFASDGIAMARCMTNGKWAGPMMTCREESCFDLGDITYGVRYGEGPFKVGSKVNYECDKGFRLVGSPTLTCSKGGIWDDHKPTCQIAATDSCEKLRAPRHGTKIGRSYKINSIVTVVCDSGYKLRGSQKRICRKDGTWSGEEPECIPVDCGHPGELYNGYIEGDKFTYGSVIRYRCLDGTTFDGMAISSTCLESGMWSFPLPKCLRSCTRPDVSNAQLQIGDRSAPLIIEHNTQITVTCEEGLAPSSSEKPTCNNGTWTYLPTCVQGGCDQRPKEISNGMALYRGTRYGDRVRYTCNAGYKLIGDIYLTCEGGEWKGKLPECKPVYCPHPGDMSNGKILLVGDIGKFEYRPNVRHASQGEKIEYYCSSGFRLEGPSASTCIDGVWSPERRPTCIDNQHPMLPGSQELFTT